LYYDWRDDGSFLLRLCSYHEKIKLFGFGVNIFFYKKHGTWTGAAVCYFLPLYFGTQVS